MFRGLQHLQRQLADLHGLDLWLPSFNYPWPHPFFVGGGMRGEKTVKQYTFGKFHSSVSYLDRLIACLRLDYV